MIKETLDMLHALNYYNVSNTVEIAKGKHEYVTTLREARVKLKRAWRLKKL